ncbi:MAG: Ig-like domain-containing protein, partial [Actinomycetota bacterium]|nr:Ig-like domain-containing protein [Actinomycetota bacterium]
MRRRLTTLRELLALVIVATFVAGVVVIAIRADARSAVRTETNDGGAWLVNGQYGVIGQVNRASMEISGAVEVAEPGTAFDVEQRGQIVLVNNIDKLELTTVDPRTYSKKTTIKLESEVRSTVVDGGAVLWQESPLSVWYLTEQQLIGIDDLSEVEPIITAEGDGLLAVTRNGDVLVLDRASDRLGRFPTEPDAAAEPDVAFVPMLEHAADITALSAVGDDALLMDDSSISVIPAAAADEESLRLAFETSVALESTDGHVLAQPTGADDEIALVAPDGRVLTAPSIAPEPAEDAAADAEPPAWTASEVSTVGGVSPLEPIVYGGCVFALSAKPVIFTRTCGGEENARAELGEFESQALRLRLVNGYVWVNDIDSGKFAVANTTGEIERLDDWGPAVGDSKQPDDDKSSTGDESPDDVSSPETLEDTPEKDEDGINQPPQAIDDAVTTRVDTPVVVPVLDNDRDADGDILLVTAVDDVPEGLAVSPIADHTKIQVIPPAGTPGTYSFR